MLLQGFVGLMIAGIFLVLSENVICKFPIEKYKLVTLKHYKIIMKMARRFRTQIRLIRLRRKVSPTVTLIMK